MPSCRRPCPSRWRATDMRRLVLLALFALIALTEACAVGPGYRRSSLGMPDGWRPRAASEDSLRRFYDSLRTSRDTLLPAGADTARVPFAYDTTYPGPHGDSTVALRWLDLIQDSVLRQLVDTSLRANRDMRTALAVIDEFRAQYRATRGALLPELTANGQAGRNQTVFGTFGSFTYNVYRATADLSWELDVWGRLRRATSAARSELVAREEDRRALRLSLIGDVATAYFDLRAADLNLAIARRTLDSRRQTLALARRRLDQGLISELDVRQFEAEVASPAASVADFERQVAQQENAQTVLVALREVEDALVGLRTAQDRTGAQERQVIALRRALELADMRYRNGVSSYLDVLDAQRGLFGAELGLTQAERDQLVAAVQLYRAVGAGWPAVKE